MAWLKCSKCGGGYDGRGNSVYCGGCRVALKSERNRAYRDGIEPWRAGFLAWRSEVLRGKTVKGLRRNGISILEQEYRGLVGECVYCGGEGWGLAKRALGGVWEVGNVVCCCGPCGVMKRGLGHEEFVGRCVTIGGRYS